MPQSSGELHDIDGGGTSGWQVPFTHCELGGQGGRPGPHIGIVPPPPPPPPMQNPNRHI
jgi:hypothetical protein